MKSERVFTVLTPLPYFSEQPLLTRFRNALPGVKWGRYLAGTVTGVPGAWIAAYLRRSVVERKTAKTPELDALSGGKCFDHVREHRVDGRGHGRTG